MIAGRRYLERGRPVVALVGWGDGRGVPALTGRFFVDGPTQPPARFGPKNVLLRRETTGEVVVRGFRGLRLPKETP